MRISPIEWGIIRPADFFLAMRAHFEDRRAQDEYLFGLVRAAAAKIVLPFISAKSRPASLDKFWPSPFREEEGTAAPQMTAEERARSIQRLLEKLNLEDDGEEESQG